MNVSALTFALLLPPVPQGGSQPKSKPSDPTALSAVQGKTHRPRRQRNLDGRWQFRAGVGEIPVLAGSFKLAFDMGYHFNDYVYVGGIVQLRDHLERDSESWNAGGIGLEGLQDSREHTGVRVFLGTRLRPHRYSPYLAAGLIFNGSDTETMRFDGRERTLGQGRYTGEFTIVQRRPFGLRPAVGLGYSLELAKGLSLGLEFTGAWFFKASTPEVEIRAEGFSLAEQDKTVLLERVEEVYADNWHNRYHLFLLSAGYAF